MRMRCVPAQRLAHLEDLIETYGRNTVFRGSTDLLDKAESCKELYSIGPSNTGQSYVRR